MIAKRQTFPNVSPLKVEVDEMIGWTRAKILPDDIDPVPRKIEARRTYKISILAGVQRRGRSVTHPESRTIQVAVPQKELHQPHPFGPRMR